MRIIEYFYCKGRHFFERMHKIIVHKSCDICKGGNPNCLECKYNHHLSDLELIGTKDLFVRDWDKVYYRYKKKTQRIVNSGLKIEEKRRCQIWTNGLKKMVVNMA